MCKHRLQPVLILFFPGKIKNVQENIVFIDNKCTRSKEGEQLDSYFISQFDAVDKENRKIRQIATAKTLGLIL